MSASQFIDHYGTRHALNYAGHPKCDAPLVWSVTLHVRDCGKCYGPSPDFSSSTLTDLQKLTDERNQERDITVRLEQENAVLRQRVETEWFNGNLAAGVRDRLLAPADGAE